MTDVLKVSLALRLFAALAVLCLPSACGQSNSSVVAPTAVSASPFKVHASVQDLMEALVDPSADGVWDSVGATVTQKGTVNHQPRTEEEWKRVRLHAIALIEATNLLMMDGRRLVPEGGKILDEGSDGVLSTVEAEQLLKTQHATFVQFASALNDVAVQMLKAIDAKNPETMMTVGEAMDEVCEGCHTTFWYPKQAVWKISSSERRN